MKSPGLLAKLWLSVRRRMWCVFLLVGIMWLLEAADFFLAPGRSLDRFGIRPRELSSLPGIAGSWFLHMNVGHLLSNTPGLLVLGGVVSLSGRWLFLQVAVFTGVAAGVGAWLFGTGGSIVLGASGVVYGLLGFLIARGWVSQRLNWTLVSIAIGYFFIWDILGLAKINPMHSWASHFWGFVGGLGLAWWKHRRAPVQVILPAAAAAPSAGSALLSKPARTKVPRS